MKTPLAAGLIFSRDRALQLDAALHSLWAHCLDVDRLHLTVLYHSSAAVFCHQYAQLAAEFRGYQNLVFVAQRNFWRDTLGWLAQQAGVRRFNHSEAARRAGDLQSYRLLLWLGRRFSGLRRRLFDFDSPRRVLFLVDDNLFVRDFRLTDASRALEQMPQALGFSLRLGANTTHCYPLDRAQALPPFTPVGPGILTYDWTQAELDFGYPLEVSSSLYRSDDLLPFLDGEPFANPNQLESRLAGGAARFRTRPQLLCYTRSVAFSAPVNVVADAYRNRSIETPATSSLELARKFDAGWRVDTVPFDGFTPNACHQEVSFSYLRIDEHGRR